MKECRGFRALISLAHLLSDEIYAFHLRPKMKRYKFEQEIVWQQYKAKIKLKNSADSEI